MEDLSDEIIEERHARCEMAEKKRFLAFAQIHKRTGGRPGRSESTSALLQLGRSESTINLDPLHSEGALIRNASTPVLSDLNGDTEIKIEADLDIEMKDETSSVKSESCEKAEDIITPRSRSASVTKLRSRGSSVSMESNRTFSESNASFTPWQYVAPWPLRIFPLTENEYNLMKLGQELPSAIVTPARLMRQSMPLDIGDPGSGSSTLTVESGGASPLSSEDEIIEDPDDPEWTVLSPRNVQQPKSGLVLKLSRK